jgi:uncharacterized repeat protein (TIGR03803 family)
MKMADHSRRSTSGMNEYGLRSVFMLALIVSSIMLETRTMQAQTYSVLHSFAGAPDGCKPQGDLLRDGAGNLYGTTANCGSGNGVVFKISAAGKETILYRFTGKTDGGLPEAGLIRDKAGNLYGTAYAGGASGDGVVFELSKGKETVLHSFSGSDGAHPTASLVRDAAGNLYGTTFYGGTASCGCGTVFKIDTTGAETVLYSFTGGTDGKFPAGRLLPDSVGNLYGTASEGGAVNCGRFGMYGCGVVFKVDSSAHETVLYSFTGGADGGQPLAGLIRDSAGNFYGTTFSAGNLSRPCALNNGCGVVFKLSKADQETVLYTFTNGTDGANPTADLARDSAGNLYGTTKLGGAGYGVVFEIQGGSESALYTFQGSNDGAGPLAGLIRDSSGNLYGTTSFGGSATEGVVFKLAP